MTDTDGLVVHRHRGYIQTTRSKGHFAVCGTCGWQGPDRLTYQRAVKDGEQHREHTGYRWDPVAGRMVPR